MPEIKKAGRPRTSVDGGRRNAKVVVYVSEAEQESLRDKANKSGQTYSAYVRNALLGANAGN